MWKLAGRQGKGQHQGEVLTIEGALSRAPSMGQGSGSFSRFLLNLTLACSIH